MARAAHLRLFTLVQARAGRQMTEHKLICSLTKTSLRGLQCRVLRGEACVEEEGKGNWPRPLEAVSDVTQEVCACQQEHEERLDSHTLLLSLANTVASHCHCHVMSCSWCSVTNMHSDYPVTFSVDHICDYLCATVTRYNDR